MFNVSYGTFISEKKKNSADLLTHYLSQSTRQYLHCLVISTEFINIFRRVI